MAGKALVFGVVVCAVVSVVGPRTAVAHAGGAYVPGEVIVKPLAEMRPTQGEALRWRHGARVKERLPGIGAQVWSLPPGSDPERVAAEMGRSGTVAYAVPNYLRRLTLLPGD